MESATLSIRQPYAQWIVLGTKRFECRTWNTSFRGRIWIHASSKSPGRDVTDAISDDEYVTNAAFDAGWFRSADLKELPRSAVIGSVEVVAVHAAGSIRHRLSALDQAMCGHIGDDAFLWELENPQMIEPVTDVNGKLNLWPLPEAVARSAAKAKTLAVPPRADWSLDDMDEECFLGFWRRRFEGPGAAIPGTQTDSPREFWRAFGTWLEGLGAPKADDEVLHTDDVVAALLPSGRRTRRAVVEKVFEKLFAEYDSDVARRLLASVQAGG